MTKKKVILRENRHLSSPENITVVMHMEDKQGISMTSSLPLSFLPSFLPSLSLSLSPPFLSLSLLSFLHSFLSLFFLFPFLSFKLKRDLTTRNSQLPQRCDSTTENILFIPKPIWTYSNRDSVNSWLNFYNKFAWINSLFHHKSYDELSNCISCHSHVTDGTLWKKSLLVVFASLLPSLFFGSYFLLIQWHFGGKVQRSYHKYTHELIPP